MKLECTKGEEQMVRKGLLPIPEEMQQLKKLASRPCQQCGKELGGEWLLGPVCGKCCRANHKRVAGR